MTHPTHYFQLPIFLVQVLDELSKYPEDEQCVVDKKFIDLLSAMSTINQTRVQKRLTAITKLEDMADTVIASQKRKSEHAENLLQTALIIDEYVFSPGIRLYDLSFTIIQLMQFVHWHIRPLKF